MPHSPTPAQLTAVLALLVATSLTGCQRAYYGTMEAFGVHKRDILVDRVEAARDDQNQAKDQFKSALDQFMAVVNVDGGELQAKYETLRTELDRCRDDADRVTSRIDSVESVGEALFKEWERELDAYQSDELRRASQKKLLTTRRKYDQLIIAMRRAEGKMAPVLAAFNDHVLYLKHNLNARAIASLEDEADALEGDVARLVAEMQASIEEADAFISSMGDDQG